MKAYSRSALAVISMAAILTGCATTGTGSNFRPIVDNKGVDLNRYEADLLECQEYAKKTPNAGKSGAGGAAVGAALGLALALIGGDKKLASAGAGAVVGGAVGASAGETSQRDIIRNCLTGRGYKVLK